MKHLFLIIIISFLPISFVSAHDNMNELKDLNNRIRVLSAKIRSLESYVLSHAHSGDGRHVVMPSDVGSTPMSVPDVGDMGRKAPVRRGRQLPSEPIHPSGSATGISFDKGPGEGSR